jgi:hypothetical protein
MTESLIDAVASLGVPLLFFVVAGLAFADTAFLAYLVVPGEVGLVPIRSIVHSGASRSDGLVLADSVDGALAVFVHLSRRVWGCSAGGRAHPTVT